MHEIVHHHEELVGERRVPGAIVIPGVSEDGYVMIPVEKYDLLLTKDHEVGIDKLHDLGGREEHPPQSTLLVQEPKSV